MGILAIKTLRSQKFVTFKEIIVFFLFFFKEVGKVLKTGEKFDYL